MGTPHAERRGEGAPSSGNFCGNVDACVTAVVNEHADAACEAWGKVASYSGWGAVLLGAGPSVDCEWSP